MGVYDQLQQISKTSTVAAPEPQKTVEVAPSREVKVVPTQPAVKKPTAPKREEPKPEEKPKFLIDRIPTRQRIITRASFEVYQDQLQVLREVSLTAKLAGEQLSISEMVREALDSYLTSKNIK
jgi:hypothetical protein